MFMPPAYLATVESAPMSDDALRPLRSAGRGLTREQVDGLLARGPAIVPGLREIVADDVLWADQGPEGWAVVHAWLLLAALRPPDSLDLLVRSLEKAYEHEVDGVADHAPLLLSGFGPSALPVLAAAAADPARPLQVRLDLLIAIAWTARRHPELRDAGADLLRKHASDPKAEPEFKRMAAANLLDFARPADRAFLTKAADGEFFDEDAVEAVYRDGPEPPPPLDAWLEAYDGAFGDEDAAGPELDLEALAAQRDLLAPLDDLVPAEGPLRAEAKVGRNDPCPCGSGKKYKKCCGA
jgi:hypothetical protein